MFKRSNIFFDILNFSSDYVINRSKDYFIVKKKRTPQMLNIRIDITIQKKKENVL
jgi:hypothetical protein